VFLRRVTLESGLLLGGFLFLAGLLVAPGSPGAGRPAVSVRSLKFARFFSGHVAVSRRAGDFASFFLSMLGISRGTYIGDYDLK